ncbi:GtrA family protein [Streptomyces sp. MUSC 14]|uniref:GtrA family protein n=1 Tax=Streptomyces sp. MUSC 14 TaxID=1354889 RepID=UPI000A765EFE|nr:GtrA family protein [Streptomyces sp. MUSC 14]
MRRLSARRGAATWLGRTELTSEVFWFVVIGVASTAAQAMLYWVPRQWSPPILANFTSLLVVTVLNTEANRRLTFHGSPVRVLQAHLAAGGLFVLAYLVTSGALLLLRHYRLTSTRNPGTWSWSPSPDSRRVAK